MVSHAFDRKIPCAKRILNAEIPDRDRVKSKDNVITPRLWYNMVLNVRCARIMFASIFLKIDNYRLFQMSKNAFKKRYLFYHFTRAQRIMATNTIQKLWVIQTDDFPMRFRNIVSQYCYGGVRLSLRIHLLAKFWF